MSNKKRIGIAVAAALMLGASGAALATPVDVNGVMWNTDSPFNLTIQSLNLRESSVAKVGDVLTGYGEIGSINGNKNFCPTCDLTFTFTYTVSSITGPQVTFNAGSFQFYTQAPGSFNFGNPGSVGGTPWVTLMGHASDNTTYVVQGQQLYSTVVGTTSHPKNGSTGFGLVDATGGPAQSALDIYTVSDGMGGFANLTLNSSFLFMPASTCKSVSGDPASICHYPIEGNGSLVSLPVASVPEPGELGLLGLGLGILGYFGWRRRKEAENQA